MSKRSRQRKREAKQLGIPFPKNNKTEVKTKEIVLLDRINFLRNKLENGVTIDKKGKSKELTNSEINQIKVELANAEEKLKIQKYEQRLSSTTTTTTDNSNT